MNGMQIKDDKKIQQLIEFYLKYSVDIVLIIEPNIKWTSITEDIMKRKIKELRRNLEMIVADSKAHQTTKND